MIIPSKRYHAQALNVSLRLMPMLAKLVLTLYMGRYFTLADIGSYGLVFGAVSILSGLLGQRLDYIVTREIVGVTPTMALYKIRDQVVLYGINYLAFALIIAGMILAGGAGLEPKYLIYILILTVLEGYSNVTYANMNSLNQQLLANAMFFIRSGLWVLPVLLLCVVSPALRNVDTVLISWSIGVATSLLMTLWFWRALPWHDVMRLPVDWQWLVQGVKKTSLIWLGMVGLVGGVFVDRFVVLHYLNINFVGILTFYASFTNAILTLMQSGVMAFAYPRLIVAHRDGKTAEFRHEARQTVLQTALGAGLLALSLAVVVPFFGKIFNRPAFVAEEWTFWLMLLGTWMRVDADALYNILFARHQDRAIWLGNLLFFIPAFGGNILLVSLLGFSGIGYSTIIAAAFLLIWRTWYVCRPEEARHGGKP